MTNEEQKAIEYLKENLLVRTENGKIVAVGNSYKLILLNLIEKQSKEIEYLKSQIPIDKIFYYSYRDFISKDKIRELRAKIEDKLHIVTPSCSEIEKINEFKNEGAVNILDELLEE